MEQKHKLKREEAEEKGVRTGRLDLGEKGVGTGREELTKGRKGGGN